MLLPLLLEAFILRLGLRLVLRLGFAVGPLLLLLLVLLPLLWLRFESFNKWVFELSFN